MRAILKVIPMGKALT